MVQVLPVSTMSNYGGLLRNWLEFDTYWAQFSVKFHTFPQFLTTACFNPLHFDTLAKKEKHPIWVGVVHFFQQPECGGTSPWKFNKISDRRPSVLYHPPPPPPPPPPAIQNTWSVISSKVLPQN